MLSRRVQFLEDALKKTTAMSEQIRTFHTEHEQNIQAMYEQLMMVYGVCEADIPREDGVEELELRADLHFEVGVREFECGGGRG